jgi:cytochrome b involved in lipid metabolism
MDSSNRNTSWSWQAREDIWIDPNWWVANNKIDRLKSDPELQNDPIKFKKVIEQLNKETSGIIDNNKISINEVKSHSIKEDCWTIFEWYVYNLTEFFNSPAGWDIPTDVCWVDWATSFWNSYGWNIAVENILNTMKIWRLISN